MISDTRPVLTLYDRIRDIADKRLVATVAAYDVAPTEYAERYSEVDTTLLRDQFVQHLPATEGLVLDAGCGTGRDTKGFAELGVDVIGADMSSGLLREAAEQARDPRLLQCDFRFLPFASNTIRGVWAMASFCHLDPLSIILALNEFRRVITPEGVVFVSTYAGTGEKSKPSYYGQRRWFYCYSDQEIKHFCSSAKLKILSLETTTGSIGGSWHNALMLPS